MDRLAGTDLVRQAIAEGRFTDFLARWESDEAAFREMRRPYLLY